MRLEDKPSCLPSKVRTAVPHQSGPSAARTWAGAPDALGGGIVEGGETRPGERGLNLELADADVDVLHGRTEVLVDLLFQLGHLAFEAPGVLLALLRLQDQGRRICARACPARPSPRLEWNEASPVANLTTASR